MDNFEPFCYHCKEVFEHEWGPIKTCDYTHQLLCAVTETKCLCIFEDRESEPVIEYVCGLKGRLDFVKYLHDHRLIFVASKFELMTLQKDNMQRDTYLETDLDIKAIEWSFTEASFIVWNKKENEIVSFGFGDHRFTLLSRISLDTPIPVSGVVEVGSRHAQSQGASAMMHTKDMATNTPPKIIHSNDEDQIIYNDPPSIAWSLSGWVVNFSRNRKRLIRVYSNHMEPVFESEPSLNLGPTASFTFHGMSLACCAIELGCNKIVIFDKYGRIKEEFFVPQTKGIIKKVRFHPEPTMLAVVSEDAPEREQYITLYFKSNNRWYLKQELFYPNGIKIYDVFWQSDVFNVSKLIVVTDKYVEWHTFRVVIHRSPHDATMVVVDGRYIEFNKFDVSIKPPPCFYNRLEHIRPINQIHFNPILKQCLVIDSHCQTQVFDYSGRFVIPAYLSINPSLTSLANVAAVHWIDVCAVEIIIEANIESKITNENNGFEQTYIIKNCNAGKRGFPYRISDSLAPKHTELLARNVIRKDDYGMLTAFGVITYQFSHTSTRELFVEGKLICKDVTSYCIYKKYLFFTHMTSNMYTIRLTNAATFEHELNLERCYKRPIAQGLRILTVTDRLIPLVVLTHPRGNLESIASAMVAIDLVDEMLKAHQWGEALQLMRDQRINWNVLIELNPDRFQVCIQEFLNAVGTESFLISIVQDFDPYRVTLNTTYKNLLQSKVEVTSEEKIKIIEDILRHLIFSNPVANFFAIVAIQLKHISLLSAVKSVQRLYYRNYRKFSEMCRRAITSMLDTADVKDIIDVAYNLYDSEFVLFVYQCTNEDPKVYEREVRDLEQYMDDVSILRFHMCIKGHNPKGAIKYMLRYDGFDEALVEKFIFHNDLQKEAYKTVDPCHRNYFLIIRLYAQSLSRKRKFQEAAVVYMNAGLYKEAIEECRLGLDWREVIRLMTVLNYDESVKRDVLGKIADDLIKEKRVEEAVIVLEHHKKDYKKTIKTLMEFKSFRHAICLAVSLGLDLELPTIADGLNKYLGELKEKLLSFKEQFERYRRRLKIARKEQTNRFELDALGIYNQNTEEELSDIASTSSSMPSTSSGRTSSTTMTAKSRRKHERRKIDLKEGGKYEDIALIRALHILYTETFLFGNDVREVCLITVHINQNDVFFLHDSLNELQKDMKRAVNEIWPEVFIKNQLSTDAEIMAIIHNREELDPRYREPPLEVMKLEWQLDMFC